MNAIIWITPVLVIVAAIVHMLLASKPLTAARVVEIWFLQLVFWAIGVASIVRAYFQVADPWSAIIANELGLPANTPFQSLLGCRLFVIGFCGLAVIWFRGGWLVAIVTAFAIFSVSETLFLSAYNFLFGTQWLMVISNAVTGFVAFTMLIVYRLVAGAKSFWLPVPPIYEEA